MRCERFTFTGCGGAQLPARLWLPDTDPVLVLQVVHGMTEHMGRYEEFARNLTAQGIAVAGFDLRGHGENPSQQDVASFGVSGWEASIEDIRLFARMLHARFLALPRFILGFSLGSFLLREYLTLQPEPVRGAIIMGSGYQSPAVLKIMSAIVKTQIKKAGFDSSTKLVHQLSFGAYNQHFKPNRTPSDWLCASPDQLDIYLADPLCRKTISAGLFHQLLSAMRRTGTKASCAAIPSDLPLLLLSGAEDPVGSFSKGVKSLHSLLKSSGHENVTLRLFSGARHSLLDEKKCGAAREVMGLIGQWMQENK